MVSFTVSPSISRILSPRSLLIVLIIISSLQSLSLGHEFGKRRLLGFKETPAGGNSTFECSPSGPCVPCQYSEKNDDKYRCSETGYRIPFKCVKIGDLTKEVSSKKPQNGRSTMEGSLTNADNASMKHRTLADNTSGQEDESQGYVTYRSCIQAENEERLSILGFEVLMLGLLLVSGSFVFFRRKRSVATAGAGGVRMQTTSRF